MTKLFTLIILQELRLLVRTYHQWFQPLFFYLLIVVLMILSIGSSSHLLNTIAPGILWTPVILLQFMNLERLFVNDLALGICDQWLLAPQPFSIILLAKVFAHWLFYQLPLVVMAPIIGFMLLKMPLPVCKILFLSLLFATPTLTLLGAIIAALTASLRHGTLLLALVLLPFYVPILIFGAGVVQYAAMQLPCQGVLALLAAMMMLSLSLTPLAISAALRLSIQQL